MREVLFFSTKQENLTTGAGKVCKLCHFWKKNLIKLAKFNRYYNMEYLNVLVNIYLFIKHHLDHLLQIYSRFNLLN